MQAHAGAAGVKAEGRPEPKLPGLLRGADSALRHEAVTGRTGKIAPETVRQPDDGDEAADGQTAIAEIDLKSAPE